jgi:hypothetical protein
MKIKDHMVQLTYWQAIVWAGMLLLAGHEYGGSLFNW